MKQNQYDKATRPLPMKLVECDSLTGIVAAEMFFFQLSWPTKTNAHSDVIPLSDLMLVQPEVMVEFSTTIHIKLTMLI